MQSVSTLPAYCVANAALAVLSPLSPLAWSLSPSETLYRSAISGCVVAFWYAVSAGAVGPVASSQDQNASHA